MEKAVFKILNAYKEPWDRNTQRAELLKRNANFLKELENVKEELGGDLFFKVRNISFNEIMMDKTRENILLKNDYPKNPIYRLDKKCWEKLRIGQDIIKRYTILEREYKPKWKEFCIRWHIEPKWNGNISSLKKFMRPPLLLHRVEDNKRGISTIILTIDNWTINKDIRDAWHEVEKYQNIIWKKQEKRTNFMRDLCWYDLSEKCGMKPKQIAELWVQKFPEEIDLFVVRRMKKEIEKEKKEKLKGRVLTDSQWLNEIKFGFLSNDYNFQLDWNSYALGKEGKGKFTPPFIYTIKKAIKRMKEQIKQIEISYFDPIEKIEEKAFLLDYKITRLTSD